jgi:hypothetical protein
MTGDRLLNTGTRPWAGLSRITFGERRYKPAAAQLLPTFPLGDRQTGR